MAILILKCTAIWMLFIPIAILNGMARQWLLSPLVGQRLALPLSGVSCAFLFLLLAWFALPRVGPLPSRLCVLVGLVWLTLTILFEFLFGRLVARKSWEELLRAYDPAGGNLWLLVLLIIALSPWLVARLRG